MEPFAFRLPSTLWALRMTEIVKASDKGITGAALFVSRKDAENFGSRIGAKPEKYKPEGEWVFVHFGKRAECLYI